VDMHFVLQDEIIGEGSYSHVVLAKHEKGLYAAKVVNLRSRKRYYEREIRALSRIHANGHKEGVVPLIQYGEDGTSGYIFTPYVASGTLYDYVNSKEGLGELEALEIFEQILTGVSATHDANVVHADLKPENILYDTKERKATIFDYGLSLEVDKDDKMVRECCGSPLYMAPEVILRKPKHNGVLSDIWSLGVLFYYMLFADFPWGDVEDLEDLVQAIARATITFPRVVEKKLRDLLRAMLQRNPLKRPSLHSIKTMVQAALRRIREKLGLETDVEEKGREVVGTRSPIASHPKGEWKRRGREVKVGVMNPMGLYSSGEPKEVPVRVQR